MGSKPARAAVATRFLAGPAGRVAGACVGGQTLARTGRSSSEGSVGPGFSFPISPSGPPNVLTGRGAQALDHENGAGRGSIPPKTDAAPSRSRPRHAHSTPRGTGSSGKPLTHGLTPSLTDRYGEAGVGPGGPLGVCAWWDRSIALVRRGSAALGLEWLLTWKRQDLSKKEVRTPGQVPSSSEPGDPAVPPVGDRADGVPILSAHREAQPGPGARAGRHKELVLDARPRNEAPSHPSPPGPAATRGE